MQTRSAIAFLLVAILLCAATGNRPILASEAGIPAPKGATWTEVVKEADGSPVLVVHYPWKVHYRPSVEVRPLEDKNIDEASVRPIRFVAEYMKGETKAALFEARERANELPVVKKMTKGDREFLVVGQQNRLGRGAMHVLLPAKERKKLPSALETAADELMPRLVYCLLDDWAFDQRTLRLELPKPEFSTPGKIRVWFLREGNVLWQETVAWPGLGDVGKPDSQPTGVR